jgi:hypothetical protein
MEIHPSQTGDVRRSAGNKILNAARPEVVRGIPVFTIQVKDWAGTFQQKRVEEPRIDW